MKRVLVLYGYGTFAALLFYGMLAIIPAYGAIILVNYGYLTFGMLAAFLYQRTRRGWILVLLPFLAFLVIEHHAWIQKKLAERTRMNVDRSSCVSPNIPPENDVENFP